MSTSVDNIKKMIANFKTRLAECERRLPLAKAELKAASNASEVLSKTNWGEKEHVDAIAQEGRLEDEVKSLEGTIREIKTWIATEAENLTAAMSTCS